MTKAYYSNSKLPSIATAFKIYNIATLLDSQCTCNIFNHLARKNDLPMQKTPSFRLYWVYMLSHDHKNV